MGLQVRDHLDAGLSGSGVLPGGAVGGKIAAGAVPGGGLGPPGRDERSVSECVGQPPRSWMNRGAPGRDFSSPQDVTGRDRLRALARGYCQLVGYAPLAIVIHGGAGFY
jgi:hypothetical protein